MWEEALLLLASVAIGFVVGSFPFSVWVVRWIAHADVRRFGDRNPGAINAWKAGGWMVGVPVLLLDVAKGGAPVALARFIFGIEGWALVLVALSPIVGHAFSPWLRFRGGKGIATTFGVWSALTFWLVPTTLGLFIAAVMIVQTVHAWTVMMAATATLVVLVLLRVEPSLIVAFALNLVFLAWTHRRELLCTPQVRAFSRSKSKGDD
jgi:glycerol-3-phosphate acyltransferase PlsY